MKLFKRMMIILGGGITAALLIQALVIFLGFNDHEKSIRTAIVGMQGETLDQSVKNAAVGNSAFLEEQFDARFQLLEMILQSGNSETVIQSIFREKKNRDIDYILLEENEKIKLHSNPNRSSKKEILSENKFMQFVHLVKEDIGKKRYYIYASELYPGSMWIVCSDHAAGKLAVFRMDGEVLLKNLPSSSPDIVTALVYEKNFIALHNPAGTPDTVLAQMKGLCKKSEHLHSRRLIGNTGLQEKDELWRIASAHLFTKSEIKTGLHLIYAQKTPQNTVAQMAAIKDSFSGIQLLFIGAWTFTLLLIVPGLLFVTRRLSQQITSAVSFVKKVFQSEDRPRNLEMKFSTEMEELSGVLNLLRDKLSSALSRLSRSHERELRAKKEAEESNILQSGLLSSVLHEVRDPLTRIDGFAKVIQDKSGADAEISAAAEHIRVENRAMISVFRALSDLTSLDPDFCELGSYQIEPSEIIRNALSDLQNRAAQNNISFEIKNMTALDETLTTSPSILTHTVYTAAATLIRFMPQNTTLRVSSALRNNSLVFHLADQPSDHLSIASVFNSYTETGTISTPHCAVAVLNLLILKTEVEYLGADVRIEKNEEANSMIEIIIPVRAFNPAVTGVFTRPKLMADTTKVSSVARFHVAGITSSSMAGRDPFRAEGSIKAVLLANMKEPDTILYQMLFGAEGFAVAAASDEGERFGYIQNNHFDLVFLDMTLEKADDFSVISDLRKALPATTVLIVFTDSRKVEYVEKLMNSGADYCFRKPVVTADLLQSVNNLRNGG